MADACNNNHKNTKNDGNNTGDMSCHNKPRRLAHMPGHKGMFVNRR